MSRRVLVIEDYVDSAASLKDVLELFGHEVRNAYDGPTGISVARRFVPDVVLCDIGLPGMTGYDVARKLRSEASLRNTVLVALTGYTLPQERERAAEAGFTHHLAKPMDLSDLERALEDDRADPAPCSRGAAGGVHGACRCGQGEGEEDEQEATFDAAAPLPPRKNASCQ